MQQHEIHHFLERYFESNDCIVEEKNHSYMKIQLTVELDKLLMNRPFYWHYLEKTGGTPNPMALTLITGQQHPPDANGEFIHFGSPRLHQIFASTKKLGSFIRMYEAIRQDSGQNIPLNPWLCVNLKTSYQCDRKKDMISSYGIHLITGKIESNFHEQLRSLPLTRKIPDFCYTLSPFIRPVSGLKRIEAIVEQQIHEDDHSWAEDAENRWREDEELLDRFYEDEIEKPEYYQVEKEALRTQYEPKITVDIINGGLFYLSDTFLSS
ncbi:YqhG family protein [Fictibacillus sp. WQ 8-8]|uniref:YqhG family protein n=1 Tax=unclassified Fictibacillus TaxID=2644029 RepID=UPI00078212AE|nr:MULTISPECIES: YqhG family protein [unclassified Fictibacillus]MCQ6266191.1 YqhG family protein [Fictibacillus sp. WQ 8-8]UZJ80677.1 YqhG family protein [Fictibacillus sp. KU28468]